MVTNCDQLKLSAAEDKSYLADVDNAETLLRSVHSVPRLVQEMPTIQLAKILGCSDATIGKRCRKLNIAKPKPGEWEKRWATAEFGAAAISAQ